MVLFTRQTLMLQNRSKIEFSVHGGLHLHSVVTFLPPWMQLDGEEVPATDDDITADDSTPAMSDEEVEGQVGGRRLSGQQTTNDHF